MNSSKRRINAAIDSLLHGKKTARKPSAAALAKAARARVGGLGSASKMPGLTYGISAHLCAVGSKLRKVEGSTCGGCYALKGKYIMPTVAAAHANRLAAMQNLPQWTADMVTAISHYCHKVPFFRFHDSGDIQSLAHLAAICDIARAVPNVAFWLPTREKAIVLEYLATHGSFPANLAVRLSDAMVDGLAPKSADGFLTSGVSRFPQYRTCSAPDTGGRCADCRACWDRNVPRVVYGLH